jgi:hypothetical protein
MNTSINQTENGSVFRCSGCSKIHIEYKNLNFNFSEKEYTDFAKYFKELDGSHWEKQNSQLPYRRKIIVPIGHNNINILLNSEELSELKSLFSKEMLVNFMKITSFDYQLYPN